MTLPRALWLAPFVMAGSAAGQTPALYGVRSNGDLLKIDTSTGAPTLVGSSGVVCSNGTALNWGCVVGDGRGPAECGSIVEEFALVGLPAHPERIAFITRWTGQTVGTSDITGVPAGYTVRAIASEGPLYFLLTPGDPTAPQLLATNYPSFTLIGSTGQSDIVSMAMIHGGTLYALASGGGGRLYTLNTATGAATLIGGGGFDGDTRALGEMPDGTLYAAGANLRLVDPLTGSNTLVGPIGYSDVCALGGIVRAYACYADCTGPGPPPMLNVEDFSCFLARFAAGQFYCNCDESTTPPILNVADFTCFLRKYAQGCTP